MRDPAPPTDSPAADTLKTADPLLGLTVPELRTLVADLGYPPFRGSQIHRWLRKQGACELLQMTNLPAALRQTLADETAIGALPPRSVEESADGTKKYLFPTRNGGLVEAALIPEGRRVTLCLSTQVGCRRSCTFCQTARQGFQGNLEPDEIVNQYHSIPERSEITNIVYMGMGEPMDNLEATLKSIAVFTEPEGYNLPARRITVSTVGIHPGLEHFLEADPAPRPPSLAISLHNPFPEERRRLMPVENANPISETLRLIRDRREDLTRRVSFEYTLFAGFNDTQRHVDGIAKILNGLSVRVNLISFHQIPGVDLKPTPPEEMERFRDSLRVKGIRTFIRRTRGQDINAACGLLWTRNRPAAAETQ